MSTIAVQPRVFKNYLLKIAADNYEKAVNAVTLTPTSALQTYKGGTPDAVFTEAVTPTWALDIAYAQDWTTPNSLSQYLMTNIGAQVTIEFSPLGSGPKFTVTAIIVPGAIGGAIDSFGVATITLGVQGAPTFAAGTPAVPVMALANPSSGTTAGGTLVKITGTGFTGVTGATGVKFASANATSYFVESDTTIYAIAPAQAAGSKPVTVTNATGVSTTNAPYTYV